MPVQLLVKEQPSTLTPAPGNDVIAPSVIDTLPLPLVLWLASPYLAGKNLSDATRRAHDLYKQSRFTSTIDILGEDSDAESDCDRFVEAYRQAVDALAKSPLPAIRSNDEATISLKVSMFSQVVPGQNHEHQEALLSEASYRIRTVVEYAHLRKVKVTIEAEDHRWTDFHLDTYFSLLNAGYDNVGTVLQSRLFRTRDDIKRFDRRGRVRLVIGIYNESADIAETDNAVMKERLIEYAAELAARGVYLEIASHDVDCLNKFFLRVAIPQKLSPNKFETQWLLGVPRKDVQDALVSGAHFKGLAEQVPQESLPYLAELSRVGIPVRMYLPFGKDSVAGPYCKRRLKGNPNMIKYGIKNALHLR